MSKEKNDVLFDNDIDIDIKIKEPKLYKVILHNDDYTSMEFVVDILIDIFNKSFETAQKIMLEVHNNQKGICGIYTYDIATTKVSQVINISKKNQFPLKCTVEEV